MDKLGYPASFGNYSVIGEIGFGSFSVVALAYNNIDGQKYACKIMSRTRLREMNQLERVEQEIRLLSTLKHPNIAAVKKVLNFSDYIIIVMEYCSGGDLYDLLLKKDKFSDYEIRRVLSDIVDALEYIHSKGIAHRDIKLDNIVLTEDMHAKLVDFGFSTYNNLHSTICGTLEYNSPEILREEQYDPIKADMWALGVCVYTMAKGQYPWTGTEQNIIKMILNGKPKYENMSSFVVSIIKLCLVNNPKGRATAKEIKEKLNIKKTALPILPNIKSDSNDQKSAKMPRIKHFKIRNSKICKKKPFPVRKIVQNH